MKREADKQRERAWQAAAIGAAGLVLIMIVVAITTSSDPRSSSLRAKGPPPDRAELGRAGWLLLHKIATTYEDSPTTAEQARLARFLDDWSYLYPCSECAGHFRQLLAESPPDTSSRLAFMAWLCEAHNTVNGRLGKPQFPCGVDPLEARWGGCGCAEGDAA